MCFRMTRLLITFSQQVCLFVSFNSYTCILVLLESISYFPLSIVHLQFVCLCLVGAQFWTSGCFAGFFPVADPAVTGQRDGGCRAQLSEVRRFFFQTLS